MLVYLDLDLLDRRLLLERDRRRSRDLDLDFTLIPARPECLPLDKLRLLLLSFVAAAKIMEVEVKIIQNSIKERS